MHLEVISIVENEDGSANVVFEMDQKTFQKMAEIGVLKVLTDAAADIVETRQEKLDKEFDEQGSVTAYWKADGTQETVEWISDDLPDLLRKAARTIKDPTDTLWWKAAQEIEKLREAEAALQRLNSRKDEDVNAWAESLGADLAKAGEAEYAPSSDAGELVGDTTDENSGSVAPPPVERGETRLSNIMGSLWRNAEDQVVQLAETLRMIAQEPVDWTTTDHHYYAKIVGRFQSLADGALKAAPPLPPSSDVGELAARLEGHAVGLLPELKWAAHDCKEAAAKLQAQAAEIKEAEAVCDSYARENQQFYDKIAALTAQLSEAKEAFKKLAADDDTIDGYYQRAHDIAKEMLREDNTNAREDIAALTEKLERYRNALEAISIQLKIETAHAIAKATIKDEDK